LGGVSLGDGENRAAFWFVDALAVRTFHRTLGFLTPLTKDNGHDIIALQARLLERAHHAQYPLIVFRQPDEDLSLV
jgi:hypothetical protein